MNKKYLNIRIDEVVNKNNNKKIIQKESHRKHGLNF